MLAFLAAGITASQGASNITDDVNTAPILGVNTNASTYGVTGYAYTHNGHLDYIDDGNLSTAEDTYGGFPNDGVATTINSSYVGFTVSPNDIITSLTVNFKLDGDGGWFGDNGERPGGTTGDNSIPLGGNMANPTDYLIEPTLQFTLNGTNWVDVSDTSNYMSVVGADTEGSGVTGTVTFTPDAPLAGVEGIRLIGPNGGIAGNGGGGSVGGFLAVSEEDVYGVVPEPSTYAMMLVGLALLGFGVRRKLA